MSPGSSKGILPFSNAKEFFEWAGKKLAENILGGIASAIVGEIWDAIVGSGKSTEQLLRDVVELFAVELRKEFEEHDLTEAQDKLRAIISRLNERRGEIEGAGPHWWEIKPGLADRLEVLDDMTMDVISPLQRLDRSGWAAYMMAGSIHLRIHATLMEVPARKDDETTHIANSIKEYSEHHWNLWWDLVEELWYLMKPTERGDLTQEYPLKVPELPLLHLFSIVDTGYRAQLDKKELPEGLRSAFRQHGIPLSDVTVQVMSENGEWLITDIGKKQSYIIRRMGNRVSIYRLNQLRPSYYDIVETRKLLQTPGYYFEVNTPRIVEIVEALSGVTMEELISEIPPTQYAIRSRGVLDKILPGNVGVRIRPVVRDSSIYGEKEWREYWIYTRRWAIYFIPETAGSAEAIRETLYAHKSRLLFWILPRYVRHVRTIIGPLDEAIVEWKAGQDPDNVSTIAIRIPNGRYVAALVGENDRGTLSAFRENIRPEAIFQLITMEHNTIALRAWNKLYVTAELYGEGRNEGELVANRNWVRNWETFRLFDRGNNKVALRADNSKFVSTRASRGSAVSLRPKLIAHSNTIGPSETFEIVYLRQRRLLIKALHCYRTYDSDGKDECQLDIYVDGELHSTLRHDMGADKQWSPPTGYLPFWAHVEIRLKEGRFFFGSRSLGRVVIERDSKHSGEAPFMYGRAHYKLWYFVDDMD